MSDYYYDADNDVIRRKLVNALFDESGASGSPYEWIDGAYLNQETPMTEHHIAPTICVDFDGVLHSYDSGWQGLDVIPDAPVPGAMAFVLELVRRDDVKIAIYSSRSAHPQGIEAMQEWLYDHLAEHLRPEFEEHAEQEASRLMATGIQWPRTKAPALVSLDDRAVTFDGTFPEVDELLAFEPWNKR